MSKLQRAQLLAMVAMLPGAPVGAANLSAPTQYGSLNNIRVIVDGVDVTDFAQIRGGRVEVQPTSDLSARPTITLVDQETGATEVLWNVRQGQAAIAIEAVSDYARDTKSRYSVDISPSARFGRNGWTFGAGSKIIGVDPEADDPYDVQDLGLSLSKSLVSGAVMEVSLGDVGQEVGNDIIAPSLSGRGLALSFANDTFDAAAIFIGRNSPTNYIGDDHRMGVDAFRHGFRLGYTHDGDSLTWALGLQAMRWSGEDLTPDERGEAWGLTLEATHFESDTNAKLTWAQSKTPDTGPATAYAASVSRSFTLGETPLFLEASYGFADKGIHFPETFWTGDQENAALTGALTLPWGSVELGYEFARDNVARDPTRIASLFRSTRLSVSLEQLPESLSFLNNVTLEAERQFTGAANAKAYLETTGDDPDYIPKAHFDSLWLSFDFAAQNGSTSLSLSRSFYDEHMAAARHSDTITHAVALARSWTWDTWSFDAQVQLNLSEDLDPEGPAKFENIDYALGIDWTPDDLPHLAFDYSLNQSRQAFPLWDERSQSHSETFGLAADLTPWLARFGLSDTVQSTVSWQQTNTNQDGETSRFTDARLQFALTF